MKTVVGVLLLLAFSECARFSPNFKKCNRKDVDVNKCILEAAQHGVSQLTQAFPKINLPNLDPLEITDLKIGAGAQGVVNVQQNFKNCKLYGIDKTQFTDFGFNFDGKYLHAAGNIPEIKKLCQYELNGKVLLLPIVGKGPSTIILKNVNFTARFDFDKFQKKSKTHFHFINKKLTLDPESVSFNFENLFNGDKALSDNINQVLNENNKEVFGDVRSGYEDGLGEILLQILNNLFSKISIEEALD